MSSHREAVGEFHVERVLVCAGFDNAPRWRAGERLEGLFERHCDDHGRRLAVDTGELRLSFAELDARANALARHLRALGLAAGDRVGLVFDEALPAYQAMLGVLKAGAAYVPMDPGFPAERISYITEDAGVSLLLSVSTLRDLLDPIGVPVTYLDEAEPEIAARPDGRLDDAERGQPPDRLCYVVYTSGSTGKPKGVSVDHASICNFVRVAVEAYGIEPGDRVYQGLTIAFDFSVEETWVPWLAGATLVPKPDGSVLVGDELRGFLVEREVTGLCCVPTLLATIDEDIPGLRFLLVSGEACPEDLARRWQRPGRRFLNVYGPTEATVTATWAVVEPDRPVTIGVPLPTYSAVILDPDEPRALPRGQTGEIGIAGIGLATGYLNRPDLTERAFVADFLGLEHNPSGRIYRTGDLGRINDDNEIEYQGRIDTQVKVRGYRIELTEIESVVLQVPGVAQAVVNKWEPAPGRAELVAYYSERADSDGVDPGQIYARLRERLPPYMVPAFLERLDAIPMATSGKADRKALPAPTSRSLASSGEHVEAANDTERVLAEALAEALSLDRVSVEADFFDELGADSLLLAGFCARARSAGLGSLSMREVYAHPTVRGLAGSLGEAGVAARAEPAIRPSSLSHFLCGLAQLLVFLGYACAAGLLLEAGVAWDTGATGLWGEYLRAAEAGLVSLVIVVTLPVAAKWLLIGRWKPGTMPLWGLRYLRFWIVKTLIRVNPMTLFVGSPLYSLFLRALGARIGKGALILSRNPPICTDLLTVGEGAVIRNGVQLGCYRARGGRIETGPVTVGRDALVGEASVLDIGTTIGDGAQLGHVSSLHEGDVVGAGQSWHGSPARPCTVDYRNGSAAGDPARTSALDSGRPGRARQVVFSVSQLLGWILVSVPLLLVGTDLVIGLLDPARPDFANWAFYRSQLVNSLLLYFGGLAGWLAVILVVPRLLNVILKADRPYPLYGLRYSAHRAIVRLTNIKTFKYMFGDSSYITGYLRALGYNLGRLVQTGTNFGVEVKQESPFLSTVGTGTMVSDGLTIINADYSDTSFLLRRNEIAPHSYLGNDITYPPAARIGENCLLGTKVALPLDGPVRSGVGLLGSPAFEIPRTVARDMQIDAAAQREQGLPRKNRHNTGSLAFYLLFGWLNSLGILLIAVGIGSAVDRLGWAVVPLDVAASLLFSIVFLVAVERAVQLRRPLRPQFCSIYDPIFWRHERFWKLSAGSFAIFNGTPFKALLWRALGVRIGRRVFDDGCAMPEKTLVSIGDDCTINAGTTIQAHSLEEGAFKSDRIAIGSGATLGVGSFVHYGVSVGDDAVVEADAFVMKGSEPAPRSRWRGNPANELVERATLPERQEPAAV